MRKPGIGSFMPGRAGLPLAAFLFCALLAGSMGARGAGAQTPASRAAKPTVTLVPTYQPGSRLLYAIDIHTTIGGDATLHTQAEAEMHILTGAEPGRFDATLRFLSYHTTAQANSPDARKQLAQQVRTTDETANSMSPVRVRVEGDKLTVLARPQGSNYDQPVEMLVQLARTDSLPAGPVEVGDSWTHVRPQPIPTLDLSVPLTLDASLAGVVPASAHGHAQATIDLHSHGQTKLPAGALPESKAMAAQGLVPEASVSFDTTAVSEYRLPDALLLDTKSESNNLMKIRFVGPSSDAHASETAIHSTATLKLVKVTAP